MLLRLLLLLCSLTSLASADVCKDAAACEAACATKDVAACTFGAERLFEGKRGWPLDQARSLKLAKRACDANDAFGCALLGSHYQDGLGTAYAPKLALAAYEKACAGGSGLGCFNIATMYYGGHGVAQYDTAKADAYKARARTAWEAECKTSPRWCLNFTFADQSKAEVALPLATRACDAGLTVGCFEAARRRLELGQLDMLGYVKELDRLCLRANDDGSCTVLAALLMLGENNIAKDGKKAFGLLVRACDGGDRDACYSLGIEYARGEFTTKDFAATTRAFDRACDRGYGKACFAIAQNFASLKDGKRAAAYARRGCYMGHAESCSILAQLHADGIGVAKNLRESTKWATDGCRMGHMPACGMLILRDAPLPVPAHVQQQLYESACTERKLPSACRRRAKIPGK